MIDMSLFVVASILQFFTNSAESLMLVRFLMGIAIGAEYSVGWPMMSEFAPAHLRGRLMATVNLAWFSGFMIGYTTAYVLSLPSIAVPWHWILGSSTILAIALLLGRIGLPESARWLWSKGRKEEARQIAHKYLRGESEIADLEQEAVHKQGKFSELFSRKYIRATVFVSWFWFCNVLPFFGIATFADEVLKQYGLAGGLAGGVGLSFVAVVGVAVTMLLIDKAGRRVFTVPPQWIMLVIFLILGFWAHAPAALVLGLFLLFSFLNAINGVLTSVYPRGGVPDRGPRDRDRVRRSDQPAGCGDRHVPAAGRNRVDRDLAGAVDSGRRGRLRGDRVAAVGTGDQGQVVGRDGRRLRPLTPGTLTRPDRRCTSRSPKNKETTIMTVAVAHSDTPRGQAALAAAAEEAVLRGQELKVLNIIAGVDEVDANDPEIEKQVTALLADTPGLTWQLHTGPEGFDTAEALLDLAEEVGATLLVIGSRDRTRVGKLLMGSTVQRVLLEAHIPVLVVKAP